MTHDKFCPSTQDDLPLWQPPCTVCEMITRVRADEREQAARRILTAKEHLRAMPITVSPAWSVWEMQVIDACAAAARGGERA